jgi:hypothetical protein
MMVARTVVLSFTDSSQPLQQETKLEVYCVNLFKHVPTSSNTFSVGSYQPQSDLVKLVQCLENSSEEKDIRQQSVWIMSDNPTWEQYIRRDRTGISFRICRSKLGSETGARVSTHICGERRLFPQSYRIDEIVCELLQTSQRSRAITVEITTTKDTFATRTTVMV